MEEGRKFDNSKLRYDLLEPSFIRAIVQVLTHGAQKYAPNNFKKVENFKDRYYAALMRHIMAWRDGELVDSDSHLSHLAHAACNLYFLMWGDKNANRAERGYRVHKRNDTQIGVKDTCNKEDGWIRTPREWVVDLRH